MAIEEIVSNVPALENTLNTFINILKIVGGVVLAYLILWIISILINLKRTSLLKKLLEKLEENNEKLDSVLKKFGKS